MTKDVERARWIAVLAATAIALYVCWLMLKPFLAVLEWATVFVIVFYPVHKRIAARIKRPGLSAIVSSILVILVVALPLGVLIVALTHELTTAAHNLPQQMSRLLEIQSPRSAAIMDWLKNNLNLGTVELEGLVTEKLTAISGSLLSQSLGMLGNILSSIFQAFLVIFTMYYLFRDGDHIVTLLPNILPLRKDLSDAILARAVQVISASVYGVIAIAMIQGALGALAFWALGLPSPLLWGVLLTFVCMIPIAGSFLVWVPGSIYLGLSGHWTRALLLVLWGALVISTVDNFLRPRFVNKFTHLHELLVFFSVLGGIKVFGLVGIIMGPVVLAVTIALLNTFKVEGDLSQS